MIYDAVEETYTLLAANFATDFATLATAKSVTNLGTGSFFERQSADAYAGDEKPTEGGYGIGILGLSARTQARRQGGRDSQVTLQVDGFFRGTGAATLRAQAELAAEAILLTVDRIAAASSGLFGAGEGDGSVQVEIQGSAGGEGQDQYEEYVKVTFQAWDRDSV